MDPTVSPRTNFFLFANGHWVRNNPVPADKARWASFDELADRNWKLLKAILEDAAEHPGSESQSPRRWVGDFFASALGTNRIESLGFKPIHPDLDQIDAINSREAAARLLADWHLRGISCLMSVRLGPDARKSDVYALYLSQGGLGLPDREYYLAEGFAKQKAAYRQHISKNLQLLGDPPSDADALADRVVALETEMAKASRTRTELRDQEKNYNKMTLAALVDRHPNIAWAEYFTALGATNVQEVIVRQPEFLDALNRLGEEAEEVTWQTYLRWHLVRSTAHLLHATAADEDFRFYGSVLQGQPQPEPRWQRAARVIDGGSGLGEALGQLFVERHFPQEARVRMAELVENVKAVFRDRLGKLEWMTETTRQQALRKFDRFTAKIGHPDKFRDYSNVEIRRDDYLGNAQRAARASSIRDIRRLGKTVDRTEWSMTPQTVNAYFSPTQNEIVFPAGILQPPFFDLTADDAVNYGAIGSVIGHEITHGYDDQGRKYDADGNLRDWWSAKDAEEFSRRAEILVQQYGAYEPLPGARVNGRLTLGENIADLGGTSIAFEALQRALSKDPAKRQVIDGFTPEQRFFLAFAQAWRVNTRDTEIRRRLTVDTHAPPQFRAFGPLVHHPEFIAAFGLQSGDPLWKAPQERAKIW